MNPVKDLSSLTTVHIQHPNLEFPQEGESTSPFSFLVMVKGHSPASDPAYNANSSLLSPPHGLRPLLLNKVFHTSSVVKSTIGLYTYFEESHEELKDNHQFACFQF